LRNDISCPRILSTPPSIYFYILVLFIPAFGDQTIEQKKVVYAALANPQSHPSISLISNSQPQYNRPTYKIAQSSVALHSSKTHLCIPCQSSCRHNRSEVDRLIRVERL
jgi:hypothetical protein